MHFKTNPALCFNYKVVCLTLDKNKGPGKPKQARNSDLKPSPSP